MHDIEPHFKWRNKYVAAEDEQSPFYGQVYSEFSFHNRVYNYLIHPQWDEFGSETLYIKLLYVDYEDGYCIIEFIGEWNDCIASDIITLKNNIVDLLMGLRINKFIILCEHVLNYHGGDEDYYAEWSEEVSEEGGWIMLLNTLQHVREEMLRSRLHYYCFIPKTENNITWRHMEPEALFLSAENALYKTLPNG